MYGDYPPYVPVAARRKSAATAAAALKKKGRTISPVELAGRKIAATFWGNAWCENLERVQRSTRAACRGGGGTCEAAR